MSEWRTFVGEFRAPLSDLAVLLVTFTLTIVVDLTVAIEVGMVLAAFLFMKRMAEVTNVTALTREFREDNGTIEDQPIDPATVPPGVEIYEINGPFFFGAAETFKEQVGGISQRPRVLIIRMRHVPAIDSTGLHALGDVVRRSRKDGVRVILSGVHAQPLMALGRSPLLDELGEENLAGSLSEALEAARTSLEATPTTAGKKK
jgi:SulP family sulfate permease